MARAGLTDSCDIFLKIVQFICQLIRLTCCMHLQDKKVVPTHASGVSGHHHHHLTSLDEGRNSMSVTLYPGLLQHCGVQHGGSIHSGNTEPVFAIVDPDDEYEVGENSSRPCIKCKAAAEATADSAAAGISKTKSRQ